MWIKFAVSPRMFSQREYKTRFGFNEKVFYTISFTIYSSKNLCLILIIRSEISRSDHPNFAYSISIIKKLAEIVYSSVTKADTQSPCAKRLLCPTNLVLGFHHAPQQGSHPFLFLFLEFRSIYSRNEKDRQILANNVALVWRKPVLCYFLLKKQKRWATSVPKQLNNQLSFISNRFISTKSMRMCVCVCACALWKSDWGKDDESIVELQNPS